jgi:hypothetical protein
MGMFDKNEVATDNRMRQFESLSKSPVESLLSGAETVCQVAGVAANSPIAGAITKGLGIAKKFTSGLGVATLDENIDHLGKATEMAIARVEEKLDGQGVRIDKIQEKVESPEFLEGISAAVLQAQRTKQKSRLERMALLLANGVANDDLEPEALDDMLRAATELKDRDIHTLAVLFETQCKTATYHSLTSGDGIINKPREVWQALEQQKFITPGNQMDVRSSLERLKGVGFCAEIQTTDSTWLPRALVTPLGERFLARIRDIP